MIIVPPATGNKINSNETSDIIAIKGLAAAGGCSTLKYIIRAKANPTAKPNTTNDIPKISLNKIPTAIDKRWPKKTFLGWAISALWNTKTLKVVAPNENISQYPKEVSRLKKLSIPIIKVADKYRVIGRYLSLIYIFKNLLFKLYTYIKHYKNIKYCI